MANGNARPSFRNGTELRFQLTGSGRFLVVPTSSMKWEDSDQVPVPEDANSSILIPMIGIRLQWDYVDDPPLVRLKNMMGRVNFDPFLGCAPETLLFESFDVTETSRPISKPSHQSSDRTADAATDRR